MILPVLLITPIVVYPGLIMSPSFSINNIQTYQAITTQYTGTQTYNVHNSKESEYI